MLTEQTPCRHALCYMFAYDLLTSVAIVCYSPAGHYPTKHAQRTGPEPALWKRNDMQWLCA